MVSLKKNSFLVLLLTLSNSAFSIGWTLQFPPHFGYENLSQLSCNSNL